MLEEHNSQPEVSSNAPTDRAYKYVITGLLVSLLILLGSWVMYVWKVGNSLSNDSSDWSDFGGFLGGIGSAIGPTLTVAGLLFVWWQGKQGDVQNARKIDVMAQSVHELANHTKEMIAQTATMQATVKQLVSQTELMKAHQKELERQGGTLRAHLSEIELQRMSLSSQAASNQEQLLEFRKQIKMAEASYLTKRFDECFRNVNQSFDDKILFYFQIMEFEKKLERDGFDKVFYKEGAGRPILEVISLGELLLTSDTSEVDYFRKRFQLQLARSLQHRGFKHLFKAYFDESSEQKLRFKELLRGLVS